MDCGAARPYSYDFDGDLKGYLFRREMSSTDNLFFGPKPFFEMWARGFVLPDITVIRVARDFSPDLGFFVNRDGRLESRGRGEYNMSMMAVHEGVYNPAIALRDEHWSAYNLNFKALSDS